MNKNLKIVVTGVKGQLGYDCLRELAKRGYDNVFGIDIDDLDITKDEEITIHNCDLLCMSVFQHCIDVGLVCNALLKNVYRESVTKLLADKLKTDEESVISCLSYFAALHDVGKIHLYFNLIDNKLYKGMNAPGTTVSAVVTYKGELLHKDDPRYNTMFDYYWYRTDQLGEVVENIYYDEFDELQFISTSAPNYKEDGFPVASKRSIDLKPKHIDYKATFSVDLLNKQQAMLAEHRHNLLRSMPTEEELRDAQAMIINAGMSKYNNKEILETAKDIRAFKIAQEDNIKEAFK